MTEVLVVMVSALAVIAAAAVVGPRLGIASPLVLVAIGVAASFVPLFGAVHVSPEWILEGVLPPLLYSSAVSMPAMNFRREFGAISGLSVILVVGTAMVLGVFFMLVVPGLGFAWGVALGAIVSPTDAVATSIIKQTAVSKRVVAMLDGESLLNDATALVLLRTAIVATAASFSFWGALGTFAWSVAVAVVVGWAAGRLNLLVRRRVPDATANTVISFVVPFLASVPATLLGASGLVAAVVAGIVTGVRAPRVLSPRNRLSDSTNWRTLELVLEGLVFLTMGLQIKAVLAGVHEEHAGVWSAVLVALGALALTLGLRAAYVVRLLGVLARRARRRESMQPRVQDMRAQVSTPEGRQATRERASARGRRVSERDIDRFAVRVTRMLADIDYFLNEPLGPREGAAVIWAGMRGAVTVAAAQTLPADTPQRAVLVLVAFTVAALSLALQGGTIGPLLSRITPPVDAAAATEKEAGELTRVMELLRASARSVPEPPARDEEEPDIERLRVTRQYRLDVISAQREALLDARDNGTFDADVLAGVLTNLDASQLALELRGQLTD